MIKIKMLGEFTLEYNGIIIGEPDNRQKKIWILLAYLLYNRDKRLSIDDIYNFLWENPAKVTNTVSAVKTTVHRLRQMIDRFGKGLGLDILTYEDGGYMLNPSYEYCIDTEDFSALLESSLSEDSIKAVKIYDDDFLAGFKGESNWIDELSSRYHEAYVEAVNRLCPLLTDEGKYDEALKMSLHAISIEPLNEELYRNAMESMLYLGQNSEAVRLYEKMCRLFIESNGMLPSDSAREIYKKAHDLSNEIIISLDDLCTSLMESSPAEGAFLLEYDFFKTIYQSYARTVARLDEKYSIGYYVGLITVREPAQRKLRDKSLDIAIDNLKNLILLNIRKGDAVTKCSSSQFAMLLPDTNYNQAMMVLDRIKAAFYRQHPHSPVELHLSVQTIAPVKQANKKK